IDEADTALKSLPHFADVILETLQRRDVAGPDNNSVPDKPGFCLTLDQSIRDAATGDRTDLRDLECFLDECLAEYDFLLDHIDHSDHRGGNFFLDLVDDRVQPDVDIFLLCNFRGTSFRSNIEPDDHDRSRKIVGLR